ncbi:MAG TPA: imidazole glycerol phosphate synthase subunit HisF [Candidatus Dormibacteraeota bacterium]|nr:imidazole glycerol phosphate synthase subunit HisF [Candidatus Dormibacteraeota bacterium]
MLARRIIPCLDVKDGRVVKGVNFVSLVDAGDPVALARAYEAQGADELVLLDITATIEGRRALRDVVRATARELTMPFTVGGGVRGVDDVVDLLRAGCDKVSMNSAAVRSPEVIDEAARVVGGQCVVLAIDAKRTAEGWEVYVDGGRTPTGRDAVAWAREVERRGAGELLVTSIDADGTKNGYDTALLRAVREVSSLPLIASGGAGRVEHFVEAFEAGADAALAASLFHFGELPIPVLKEALRERGVAVRPAPLERGTADAR